MKRLGILGGTFDPVHVGHIAIARAALKSARLDRILFIPAAIAPHKRDQTSAPARHRMAMLKLAVRPFPDFAVSDIELRKKGISYSVETLIRLKRRQPGARLFWILGADALALLPQWKEIDEVVRMTAFLVARRPEWNLRKPPIRHLKMKSFKAPRLDVSSTDIRDRVRNDQPIDGLVADDVQHYIKRHHLYRHP